MAELTNPFRVAAARKLVVAMAINQREVSTAIAAQRGVPVAAVRIRQAYLHLDFTQSQALFK
jgi:hypothetical protein